MNWKLTSYNTQTAGDYAITKHPVMTAPGGYFYIAWHKQDELGTHPTTESARAACTEHSLGYAKRRGV